MNLFEKILLCMTMTILIALDLLLIITTIMSFSSMEIGEGILRVLGMVVATVGTILATIGTVNLLID